MNEIVTLNLFQHLIKTMCFEILKQVQDDASRHFATNRISTFLFLISLLSDLVEP